MVQTYFSNQPAASPLPVAEASFQGLSSSEKLFKVEDVQEAYIEHKDRCVRNALVMFSPITH